MAFNFTQAIKVAAVGIFTFYGSSWFFRNQKPDPSMNEFLQDIAVIEKQIKLKQKEEMEEKEAGALDLEIEEQIRK